MFQVLNIFKAAIFWIQKHKPNTYDHRRIPVPKLSDSHLPNCAYKYERRAEIPSTTLIGALEGTLFVPVFPATSGSMERQEACMGFRFQHHMITALSCMLIKWPEHKDAHHYQFKLCLK